VARIRRRVRTVWAAGYTAGATAIFAVTFCRLFAIRNRKANLAWFPERISPTRVAVAQAQRMVSAQPIAVTDPTSIRRLDQLAVTDVASAPSAAVDAPRRQPRKVLAPLLARPSAGRPRKVGGIDRGRFDGCQSCPGHT